MTRVAREIVDLAWRHAAAAGASRVTQTLATVLYGWKESKAYTYILYTFAYLLYVYSVYREHLKREGRVISCKSS